MPPAHSELRREGGAGGAGGAVGRPTRTEEGRRTTVMQLSNNPALAEKKKARQSIREAPTSAEGRQLPSKVTPQPGPTRREREYEVSGSFFFPGF